MHLDTAHRIVVAKTFGSFEESTVSVHTEAGEFVEKGAILGVVVNGQRRQEVIAPCRACVVDYLVHTGDRVRPGDHIVHLIKL